QVYAYDVVASDPDGDPLTYTLSQSPAGMSVAANGQLRWTPEATQAGTHEVILVVGDGRGGTATQTWPISGTSAGGGNRAPRVTSTPGTPATVGTPYTYDVEAADADHDTLVYSLVQAPGGLTIDSASGVVAWTPAAAGTYAITLRVDDGNGHGALQSYTLVVR